MKRLAIALLATASFGGAAYADANDFTPRPQAQAYGAYSVRGGGYVIGPSMFSWRPVARKRTGASCNLQRPGRSGGWYC